MLLRFRIHLVAARHRADFNPALFGRVTRHQFVQRRLHHQLLFAQRAGQLLDRRRLVRRVNNRFQRRSSLFVRHIFWWHSHSWLCAFFSTATHLLSPAIRPPIIPPSFRTERADAFSSPLLLQRVGLGREKSLLLFSAVSVSSVPAPAPTLSV